ncbi:hypothetical protein BC939DRAFT_435661, partial [Gamsiella multidivaricata]|uniref:uncharacterized protein n=1 Tax=Gamsiella multidivaricata TaxID=101098 RepID=UPI0022208254
MGLGLSFSTVLWFFLCALSPFKAIFSARGIFVPLFAFFYTDGDRIEYRLSDQHLRASQGAFCLFLWSCFLSV